jgi:hypothetical protein
MRQIFIKSGHLLPPICLDIPPPNNLCASFSVSTNPIFQFSLFIPHIFTFVPISSPSHPSVNNIPSAFIQIWCFKIHKRRRGRKGAKEARTKGLGADFLCALPNNGSIDWVATILQKEAKGQRRVHDLLIIGVGGKKLEFWLEKCRKDWGRNWRWPHKKKFEAHSKNFSRGMVVDQKGKVG